MDTKVLTDVQIAEFKEAYDLFDADGKGTVKVKDMMTLMRALGQHPTDTEYVDMVSEVDTDGNGTVDFPEFITLMAKLLRHNDVEEELMIAFKVFDTDGSGYIGSGELHNVLLNIGEKFTEDQINEMVTLADVDCDGQISYEEFVKMMARLNKAT
mmetsp:Transcript_118925/g.237003  ORF Transcript_118925/g.237003 Transcript_118925/m.237003 type:complete len:155 (+) Transcript_118925:163-627(+)